MDIGGVRVGILGVQHSVVLGRTKRKQIDILHFKLGSQAVLGDGLLGAVAARLDTADRLRSLRRV